MNSVYYFDSCGFVLSDASEPVSRIDFEDGFLTDIGQNLPGGPANFRDLTIFPGFIDVHTHGAAGIDVNGADAEGLITIARFLARHGVTAWLPTLVPDSDDAYKRVIDAVDEVMERQKGESIAQIVGVHYEGVFANQQMCGALRPEYFRDGRWAMDGGQLPKLSTGVHMTTLAPEVEGGIELIEQLTGEGYVVSIGHTSAGPEILDRAFEAGARHMTHFFNAMTGLHHRDIGAVGWGLSNRAVTFDIIADGVHVAGPVVEFACRSKTPDKVIVISDSVAPTGLGDGEYLLWGEKVLVERGRTRNERGSIAGSVSTMLDGAKLMLELGFAHEEVAKMTSRNPARLLGLEDSRGEIRVGKRADMVGLDSDGNVAFTMIGGEMVQ